MSITRLQRRLYSDLAHKYSETLKLPQTQFPKRSNYEATINDLIPRSSQKLYKKQLENSPIRDDVFILHDGPPYANGDLHLGHALNKILKDFINRFQLMMGKQVYYKPGWDCHGLPIELKALETITKKLKKDASITLSVKEIRNMARNHATKTVETQLKSFKQFAILTDFNDKYKTMNHNFEVNQLKIFQTMLSKNLITRQKKPVFWGCETHTALAEGELEYNDKHRSTAAYLSFPIVETSSKEMIDFLSQSSFTEASLLIWTSTPWTIASNRAISINENFIYTIIKSSNEALIVAKELASNIVEINPKFSLTDVEIPGVSLVNAQYRNPISNGTHPVIHGDHVIDNAGTGLVHTAPGHGNEDYFACLKKGIDAYSPVDNFGKYTKDVPQGFESLIGKRVLGEGGKIMLELLKNAKMTFHINPNYIHSYPYDWRSKKPIIIRATPQWFANVGKIKETASKSLDDVKFFPENGKNRLLSFIKNRNEWCISRQRSWGVPIPALYSKHDENVVLLDQESVSHIITKIDELGTDAWFEEEDNVERWLPESHRGQGADFYKGRDTMDVWFDSGSSWNEIDSFIKEHGLNRDYLADVYLEGSDQHRGWFQSSLLTKIATDFDTPRAPYKNIVTHGFTLDEKGQKMSKSIGNTISPDHVIQGKNGLPALGVDGLRLWAAQADYTHDMAIGPKILKHVGDSLKKIRISFTFMLGNLNDIESNDVVPYENLRPIDKYALSKLYELNEEVLEQYNNYNYNRVIQLLNYHLNAELSATYFDIVKDRLYIDKTDGLSRRAAQSVLTEIHQSYLSILSPILPVVTQEVWDHTLPWIKSDKSSPFLKGWNQLDSRYKNQQLEDDFEMIWRIKDEIKQLAEQGRKNDKTIKNSLETDVYLTITNQDSNIQRIVEEHSQYLADYFLVSHVHINQRLPEELRYNYTNKITVDNTEIGISNVPSPMDKCPRCWKHTAQSAEDLCQRCDEVLHE